jgi:protein-tyrosine phosphatase
MIEVHNNLFVGDLSDCQNSSDFAIVHACKTPCHQVGVGYSKNLPSNHPNYLIKATETDLYLNLVDMNRILPQFTDEPIKKSLEFIRTKLSANKKVLIHCNVGQSRSCSIAMIYLAKEKIISNNSYKEALTQFRTLYPLVNIGIGFHNYLQNNWERLMGDLQ